MRRNSARKQRGQPFTLSAVALVRRLVALVPPALLHLTRYHGVFAPHAALRPRVTVAGAASGAHSLVAEDEETAGLAGPPAAGTGPPFTTEPKGVDVLHCPCSRRRSVHAIHSTRSAAEERLRQLGHPLVPAAVLPPSTAQPQLPLVPRRPSRTCNPALATPGPSPDFEAASASVSETQRPFRA
ncbi:MAG: transposase, partial [Myxococcaceae bacterium]|nr:transposase [Myxococcaceae bacterium]